MEKKEKKKSMLDKFYEIYSNPEEVSGAKLAEKSLNRFKNSILKK